MLVHIQHLVEGPNTLHWNATADAGIRALQTTLRDLGYPVGDHFSVNAEITRLEPSYYVRGTLETTLETVCSRCAEEARLDIRAPFEIALQRTVKKPSRKGEATAAELDEAEVLCFVGNEIDLRQVIQDAFVLALPMQASCGQPDCEKKAEDLQASLRAKQAPGDGPFSILRNLKKT